MCSNLSFLVLLITKPGALLASTVQFKVWYLYLMAVYSICNIYLTIRTCFFVVSNNIGLLFEKILFYPV